MKTRETICSVFPSEPGTEIKLYLQTETQEKELGCCYSSSTLLERRRKKKKKKLQDQQCNNNDNKKIK